MLWALVIGGSIAAVGPPSSGASAEWKALTHEGPPPGWVEVVRAPRPDDTETTTWVASYSLVNGVPTEAWVEKAVTSPQQVILNEADIANKIVTVDMPAMQAILDATNATINAGPAPYLKDLAKAVRRLDRKVQRLLDGTG